jgi:5-methylcytosine-specific restriction endonuclease McrA
MNKRENYRIVILEPAATYIRDKKCAVCAKPRIEWPGKRRFRTTWNCCCAECTAEFQKSFIYVGWQDLRNKAFRRDNYTCKHCGTKPTKKRYFPTLNSEGKLTVNPNYTWNGKEEYYVGEYKDVTDDSKLIGDHIVPITLGGEEWDINNVQTLCIACNKIKTKSDIALIAERRRIEKQGFVQKVLNT